VGYWSLNNVILSLGKPEGRGERTSIAQLEKSEECKKSTKENLHRPLGWCLWGSKENPKTKEISVRFKAKKKFYYFFTLFG
jgi:hypothetical protein